jgi:putative hydrolase of the HAD superfamily
VASIKALLFDFGGTLDGAGRHWLDRFADAYRAAGLEIGREQLDPAFSHATQKGYRAWERLRGWGLRQLCEFLVEAQLQHLSENTPVSIAHELKRESADGTRYVARISDYFCAQSSAAFAGNIHLLSKLASRFTLGVVSNFYGNLDTVLSEAGLLGFFTVVVDSSRVQIFKPDPRIFNCALEKLGLPAAKAAMVGDSIDKDCMPARKIGMKTILLTAPDNSLKPANADLVSRTKVVQTSLPVDHVIHSLEELVDIQW